VGCIPLANQDGKNTVKKVGFLYHIIGRGHFCFKKFLCVQIMPPEVKFALEQTMKAQRGE
jgi:hypothetical protein